MQFAPTWFKRIIAICHTIVIDEELWAKYMAQLNRPGQQHAQLGPYFTRILKGALTNADKIDGFGRYAAPFHDEGSIPPGSQDDTFIVRLAVETGARTGHQRRTPSQRPEDVWYRIQP